MTQSKKRAIGMLLVWGSVVIVFMFIFLGGGGPSAWLQEKSRIVYMAILFGLGYISHFILLFSTRLRDGGALMRDERDDSIARRSNGAALLVVLIYVYALCIILYEIYHDAGAVPVGWMWFLGYTSVFLGNLTHAAATLALFAGMVGHGEG